jgi:DNA-binding CsgD family transcriptional regulator/PAS domain-containing protein
VIWIKRTKSFIQKIAKVVFPLLQPRLLRTQARRVAQAMRDEQKLLELIDSTYEAAITPTSWPGLLERIGDAVGHASMSLITTEDFDQPVDVWLARYDPASIEARFRQYARPDVNPFVRASMEIEPLRLVPRKRFLPDREFEKDPAARSILISQGLYHGCIATLYRAGSFLSALEVYRPRHLGEFGPSELKILRHLVPHLGHALRVTRYISASEIRQHQTEEALNRLNIGLLLLAGDGRVIFGNRAAEDLLRQGDGIRSRDGRLAATHHLDHARLAGAVARAAGQAPPCMVQALPITRGAGRRPLQIWTVPLPRTQTTMPVQILQSDVMAVVIDPESSTAPPIEALKALYGMTEAEARLTCGLLTGTRLEDYAEHAGISMNTARTHLKSIFAKTETTRQAELVRLLSRTSCAPTSESS